MIEFFKKVIQKLNKGWNNLWPKSSPSITFFLISFLIALIIALPLIYTVYQGVTADSSTWTRLINDRIPDLMVSTLSLAAVVTIAGIIIGVSLAWLVIRTDIPGRKYLRWVLVIPLAVPTYVGALSYIMAFGPYGFFEGILGSSPIDIYSFPGVALVMTIFTYPYVFLIVSATLKRINPHLEETAISCGLSYFQVFKRINLPLLRSAIGGGGLLISLYVLSDFGAVSMLRYNTFASSIYYQMTGRFDRTGAAVLSLVLIGLTFLIIGLEYYSRQNINYGHQVDSEVIQPIVELGSWKWPAFAFAIFIVILGVVLPITVLAGWLYQGIQAGVVNWDIISYAWNSIFSSAIAAVVAMVIAVPLVYLRVRYKSKASSIINSLASSGYVLPGVIVALGIIFIFNNYFPYFYGTEIMLILAFIIKFLPLSLQSSEASFRLLHHSIEDAARGMGVSTFKLFRKVIFPIALPGILAGGGLVFINSMKELTTTLMLRPAGFDTLSIRVWLQSSEGFYAESALPALILIIFAVLPLKYIIQKY